jgi:hypothetical protein
MLFKQEMLAQRVKLYIRIKGNLNGEYDSGFQDYSLGAGKPNFSPLPKTAMFLQFIYYS